MIKVYRSTIQAPGVIWNINLTDQLNVGYVYGIDAEKEELKDIVYELEEELDHEKNKKIPFKLR
jgi:glucose-6-phosphate isomerase